MHPCFKIFQPRRKSMTQPTRQLLAFSAAAVLLGTALTACGGGSDSADSGDASDTITKACAREGNNVSVTQDGCLTEYGKNTQTVACSGSNTLHVLTGTGWSLDFLKSSGSKTTAGNGQFGFNDVVLRCI
jgi:hypothetical protein